MHLKLIVKMEKRIFFIEKVGNIQFSYFLLMQR
jgi:hypothetical protein